MGVFARGRLVVSTLTTAVASLAVLLTCPTPCAADGGVFIESRYLEDASTTVQGVVQDETISSNGQRALLMDRNKAYCPDGCWSLFVEPGRVRAPRAVWVLPLPMPPSDVGRASPDLLSLLESMTRPVEIDRLEVYTQREVNTNDEGFFASSCGTSGSGSDGHTESDLADSAQVQAPTEDPAVTTLGSGRIDGVDWEVLEAESGEDLTEWLDGNGYAYPDGLGAPAQAYVDAGWVFLVTRVTRAADDFDALPGLRIDLATGPNWRPVYPMRLTPLSTKTHLDFLLFVADNGDWNMGQFDLDAMPMEDVRPALGQYPYGVYSHGLDMKGDWIIEAHSEPYYGNAGDAPATPDEACRWDTWTYAVRLEAQLSRRPRELVREFAKPLEQSDIELRTDGEPPEIPTEIRELMDERVILTRLRGRATAQGMATDIVFEPSRSNHVVTGVHRRTCTVRLSPEQAEDMGVAAQRHEAPLRAGRRLAGAPLALALLVGLFAALRRRSA